MNKIVVEGKTEYDNSGNDHFFEWAKVNGKTLLKMLEELYNDTWAWNGQRVKITIEKLR